MNFSFEELYYMYGQYDRLITIEFEYNSEAYNDFGNNIIGEFIYSLEERNELEDLFKTKINQRTNKRIRFKPTDINDKLNDQQKIKLDKEGFLCSDIATVGSFNLNQTNRFLDSGAKKIPGLMEIEFDSTGFDVNRSIIYLGSKRMEKGPKLCPDELSQYYGTVLYYMEKQGNKVPESFLNDNGDIKEDIKLYKYKALFEVGGLNDDDTNCYINLAIKRGLDRMKFVTKELKKAGTTLNKLAQKNQSYFYLLTNLCLYFDGETLLYANPPVWWDFERYIHIYLRHIKFFEQKDVFLDKTNFQYETKMIKKVIEIVLMILKVDIEEHFSLTPEKPFKRIGKRSAYYDGVYYVVEIEPSGRLVWLHPRN